MERSETDGESDTEHSTMSDSTDESGGEESTARQNTRVRVSETRDKVTLKTSVKRGTGTRDQDKGTIKCKGDSPEAVAKEIEGTLDELEDRNIFERLRGTQPERDTEEVGL